MSITRITYAIAGQTVAVRVSGDPDPANNGLHHLYTDHLGSVSAIQQANGMVQQTRYLPFGGYRAGSSPNPLTSHAYTSQRENMDIGLYYYNARYYAPTLARFLSADTIVPDPANPQSFNRYSYVENRPLNFNDPTGHCAEGYMGDDYDDAECFKLASMAIRGIGNLEIGYEGEQISLYAFDWQDEEQVDNFIKAYFDLQDDLDWAEARMDIVNSLGPTPEITKMAQDAVDSFFESTDETIGQTGFVLLATLNNQLGMDPDWNLVLSEEFKDVTQNTLGSFSETVGKLGTKGLFVYVPTAYAFAIREGTRAIVTASLAVNVEIFEASLPQLSAWASEE